MPEEITMDNRNIVLMQQRHLDELAELEKACFSHPWSRAGLEEEVDREGSLFLVAEAPDGRVMGYVGCQYVLDEGYITNVAVFPQDRRTGTAQALLSELEKKGRSLGLSFLSLEVRESNMPARSLYEKLGYCQKGRRKNFYTDPREDGLILTKTFERKEQTE